MIAFCDSMIGQWVSNRIAFELVRRERVTSVDVCLTTVPSPRYLCYGLPAKVAFPAQVADGDLRVLFSQSELAGLMARWREQTVPAVSAMERVYPEGDAKGQRSNMTPRGRR